MDSFKNFAKSDLSSGITSGATTLTVLSGHGSKFPTQPFNIVVWERSAYSDPANDTNREIMRVTAISTDTFTVTRAQEGTSAVAHNTGGSIYGVIADVTSVTLKEISDRLSLRGVVASQYSQLTASTTNIPGLSVNVEAGCTYTFIAKLWINAGPAGVITNIGGTVTHTAIIGRSVFFYDDGTPGGTIYSTSPGGLGNGFATAIDPLYFELNGTFTVNAAGTFTITIEQNTPASGTTYVYRGATLEVTKII